MIGAGGDTGGAGQGGATGGGADRDASSETIEPPTGGGGTGGAVSNGSGGAGGPTTGVGGGGGPTDGAGGGAGPTGVGGGGPVTGTGGAAGSGGSPTAPPPSCSDLFAPTLQELAIDIGAADWSAIQAEFLSAGMLTADAFVDYQPLYYPVTLHFGAEAVPAYVRLKGDSSWREAVAADGAAGKMQFVVAFDRLDSSATFHGVSKFSLDMPRADLTFLHDRIGNSFMRSLGIAALCATSARLSVNGSYYGLFTLEERMGHRLIKQFFPAIPDNDLFKGGYVAETNEDTFNWMKLQAFWAATTPAQVAAVVDLPQSFLTWAAEALLNDGDGYWGGDHNFFIYDQGDRGYVFLPNDLDSILEYIGDFTGDPVWWWSSRPGVQFIGQHYRIVMGDPALRAQYAQALRTQLARFDVAMLQSWIDTWSAQIRDAVATDPHRPMTTTLAGFDASIAAARAGIRARADFVRGWLDCQQSGTGADQDGDGFIWCRDCRDDSPAIHPGAAEICGNMTDDNCDGVYDEGCSLPPAQ
ncbi:MAG TPA: CotH kinase family protein [Polyangia bacterium]|nr:CotH kinase family protein [Polyangia bacterium]